MGHTFDFTNFEANNYSLNHKISLLKPLFMLYCFSYSLRSMSLAVCLCFLLPWLACTPSSNEAEPIVYPALFTYDHFDLKASHFFVLTPGGATEIPATGNFILFDPYLMDEEIDPETVDLPFEKVELLNEHQIHVYYFDYLGVTPGDALFPYTQSGSMISTSLTPGQDDVFRFDLDTSIPQLSMCLQSVAYSYHDGSGDLDYSPLEVELCQDAAPLDVVAQIRAKWDLQVGDTVAVNLSAFLYK